MYVRRLRLVPTRGRRVARMDAGRQSVVAVAVADPARPRSAVLVTVVVAGVVVAVLAR